MSWSIAEITALAVKAARGAGAPPEQAARFGPAATCHLLAGRDPQALSQALREAPQGAITFYPAALDAALAQLAAGGSGILSGMVHSQLLESYVAQLPFTALVRATVSGEVLLSVDFETPRQKWKAGRITGHDALIEQMEALAALTFVPETEQSRHSGAGAGLTDND